MEFKYILIVIVLVYLPVLITGQYTLRGVPESYAVLGEKYTLQCDVTDSPIAVECRKNDVFLCSILSSTCESQSTDNRYKCGCINNNNKTLYLNISNINKQDDTTWSCRGNSGGQGSTTVTVYYGPAKIRFNPTSDNIDVIEGKTQSVNCLADCKPDCNITWSKDGQYTIRGVPESYAVLGENYTLQCDVTDSPNFVQFRINNVAVCSILSSTCESQSTDNRYKCGYGPENIIFNPTSDNIDVIEGKSQSVNCLADCKPDCNITWSKDGSTTILNNPLSLSTRYQTGSYNCTVRHTVLNKQLTKQLNVQIYYGPDELTFSPDVTSIKIIEDGPDKLTFSPDVTSINIIEGRDQTITCLTDCYQCNYKWTGPVSSPTKDLVLTQIKRNQEGNYRCEATNIKNTNPKTRSKSIQVNVHYPPDITSVTSDAVNNETDEGSDITLNCNVDSKPVSTVTWSSSTSTDTNTGQQWTLTQAKCQDTGIYTCTANNGIGQSTTKSLPLNIRCKFMLSQYTIIYTCTTNNGIGQSTTKSLPLNIRCPPILKEELKKEKRGKIGEMVLLEINIEAYPEPSFIWKQLMSDVEYPFVKTEKVSENNFISTLELILDQSSFGYYIITVQNIINGETKAKTWGIKIIELGNFICII
ncbi:hypothetical protein LOTGIDRAFT_176393 [Lottia gigantea]|uniref:Ig-like domain-containing protein n=1 Tax=Lottia gigantea TaxID=225164 RepID=V4B6Z1_LOTGI|nr:hypothetical protein LOTGIDRAFT_176393 [Lottia gigantea]ESP03296.1 hypothetical protein LOTGIDRAFT_176393 [Lottia gigantea]